MFRTFAYSMATGNENMDDSNAFGFYLLGKCIRSVYISVFVRFMSCEVADEHIGLHAVLSNIGRERDMLHLNGVSALISNSAIQTPVIRGSYSNVTFTFLHAICVLCSLCEQPKNYFISCLLIFLVLLCSHNFSHTISAFLCSFRLI